ncbi:MAG: VTT domain-containing protein [Planctomycetota bacterium]
MAVTAAAVGPGVGALTLLGIAVANAEWLAAGGAGVLALLVTIGIFGCGLALLPTHALSLACGWAFGGVAGAAVAVATVTVASVVTGALARRVVGHDFVHAIHDRAPHLAGVHSALAEASTLRTMVLIALLRLSPAVPFAAMNVLLTAADIRWRSYLTGTAIGMAPRVTAVALLGGTLSSLDFDAPNAPWIAIAGIVATVIAIILIGVITREALRRVASESLDAAPATGGDAAP